MLNLTNGWEITMLEAIDEAYDIMFNNKQPVNDDMYLSYTMDKLIRIRHHRLRLTMIEQNPYKASRYAKLAKEGHRIMWVIKDKDEWLGHVDNGIWKPKEGKKPLKSQTHREPINEPAVTWLV